MHIKRELKWLLGELDPARDLDVPMHAATKAGKRRIAPKSFWN